MKYPKVNAKWHIQKVTKNLKNAFPNHHLSNIHVISYDFVQAFLHTRISGPVLPISNGVHVEVSTSVRKWNRRCQADMRSLRRRRKLLRRLQRRRLPRGSFNRVCHGFRLTKCDDWFWVDFDHFWSNCQFFEAAGSAVKIGSSLKPNQHMQIYLFRTCETLSTFIFFKALLKDPKMTSL